MTQEEYVKLFEVLDDRYVMQDDCSKKQENVNKKFANDDKRIEKLMDKFNIWDKLLWVITTTAVGGLITAVINLIIK